MSVGPQEKFMVKMLKPASISRIPKSMTIIRHLKNLSLYSFGQDMAAQTL